MTVRLVKFEDCSGSCWNYEDFRNGLRIYRLEDPKFKGCHVSVYLSGDYHAKDKKGNYVGYVNRRFIRKKISRLADMLHLFEKNVLQTLHSTVSEKIKKVIQRNAERRTELEGNSWKTHIEKFGNFKKGSKFNIIAMAPRNSKIFRRKRPSILIKPGQTNLQNFRTVLKKRVRRTEWIEVQETVQETSFELK